MNYEDVENLRYTLQGVDLVISTISGNEQLNLIDAARRARVRVFVPSEFEGDLNHRPANDPLDRGSQSALQLLESWSHSKSQRLRYTVFSCGIFMERFGPGGLQTYGIGAGCGIQGPDDYLVNIQEAKAEIIPTSSSGTPVRISLTSVYDVAQFITAAIELGLDTWPKEFRMRGDSVTVRELVETCSNALGGQLSRHFSFPAPLLSLRAPTDAVTVPISLINRHYQEVEAQAEVCQQLEDWPQWYYFQRLLQTANGRYHVRESNLNAATQVQPLTFRRWLENVWVPSL